MSENQTIKVVEELLAMSLEDSDKVAFISGVVFRTIKMDPGAVVTRIGDNHYQATRGDKYEQFRLFDNKIVRHGISFTLRGNGSYENVHYVENVLTKIEGYYQNSREFIIYTYDSYGELIGKEEYSFSEVQAASDLVVMPTDTLEYFKIWLNLRITEVKIKYPEPHEYRYVWLPNFGKDVNDFRKYLSWLEKFVEYSGYQLTGSPISKLSW